MPLVKRFALTALFCIWFVSTVFAGGYFVKDENETLSLVPFEGNPKQTFQALFDSLSAFIPKGVVVLGADIDEDGCLYLNLSKEALGYGGNYFEANFCELLAKTAFVLPSVNTFAVLIEGECIPLSEGRVIFNSTEEKLFY